MGNIWALLGQARQVEQVTEMSANQSINTDRRQKKQKIDDNDSDDEQDAVRRDDRALSVLCTKYVMSMRQCKRLALEQLLLHINLVYDIMDNKSDYNTKKFEMLVTWKEINGDEATAQKLAHCLRQIGLQEQELKTAYEILEIKEKPPPLRPPLNLYVTYLQDDTAHLEWDRPVGSANVVDYVIHVKKSTSEEWERTIHTSKELSCTIPDLQPKEQYVFKVAARNNKGTGEFTELENPVAYGNCKPGKPHNVHVADDGVVTWKEPPNGCARITGYMIKICTEDGFPEIHPVEENNLQFKPMVFFHEKRYQAQVAAINENGVGPFTTYIKRATVGSVGHVWQSTWLWENGYSQLQRRW